MQEGQSESRGEEGSRGRGCCNRQEAQPRSTGLQKPKRSPEVLEGVWPPAPTSVILLP